MKNSRQLVSLVCAALITGFAARSMAEEPKPATPEAPLSRETREQMAQMHGKMAECLRSDKDVKTCHDEMRSSCEKLGPESCMKMGHHGGRGGPHPQMKREPKTK